MNQNHIDQSHYAGFWKRFAAYVVDIAIIYAGTFVLGMLWAILFGRYVDMTGLKVLSVLLVVVYFAAFESSRYQATPGKMALHIKVTDLHGNRIDAWRAVGRYLAKIISGIILCIGYIMVAFTQKKQGLHDIIAGTLVVNTHKN